MAGLSTIAPNNKNTNGFTLVELAIVLMIIGLLIGGILRGQELLVNARITATVKQVNAYKAAVVMFRDAYYAFPGDAANATKRLPNCTAASFCRDGDADGIVGVRKEAISLMDVQSGAGGPREETTQFWKHLSTAKIISGINPAANPSEPEWGATHPNTKMGGGFMVAYGPHHAGTTLTTEALWVLTSNTLNGSNIYQPDGRNVLNPMEARRIDEKMDDGLPDAGNVHSPDNGTCDNVTSTSNGTRIYLTHEYKTCVLMFQIF